MKLRACAVSLAMAITSIATGPQPVIAEATAFEGCSIRWTGAVSSSWHDPGNWTAADGVLRTPGQFDDTCVEQPDHLPIQLDVPVPTQVKSLRARSAIPGFSTFVLTAGTLTLLEASEVEHARVDGGLLGIQDTLLADTFSLGSGTLHGGTLRAQKMYIYTESDAARAISGLSLRADILTVGVAGAPLVVSNGVSFVVNERLWVRSDINDGGGAPSSIVVRSGAEAWIEGSRIEVPSLIQGRLDVYGEVEFTHLQNLEPLESGGHRLRGSLLDIRPQATLRLPGADIRILDVIFSSYSASPLTAGTDINALRRLRLVRRPVVLSNLGRLASERSVRFESVARVQDSATLSAGGDIVFAERESANVHLEDGATMETGGTVHVRASAVLYCGGRVVGNLSNAGLVYTRHPSRCAVSGDFHQTEHGDLRLFFDRSDGLRFPEISFDGVASLAGTISFGGGPGADEIGATDVGVTARRIVGRFDDVEELGWLPRSRYAPIYSSSTVAFRAQVAPAKVRDYIARATRFRRASLSWRPPPHDYRSVIVWVYPDRGRTHGVGQSGEDWAKVGFLYTQMDYVFVATTSYDYPTPDAPAQSYRLFGTALDAKDSRTRDGVIFTGVLRRAKTREVLARRRVLLQRRQGPDAAWQTIAQRSTSAEGRVRFPPRPLRMGRYRLLFHGRGRYLGDNSDAMKGRPR